MPLSIANVTIALQGFRGLPNVFPTQPRHSLGQRGLGGCAAADSGAVVGDEQGKMILNARRARRDQFSVATQRSYMRSSGLVREVPSAQSVSAAVRDRTPSVRS